MLGELIIAFHGWVVRARSVLAGVATAQAQVPPPPDVMRRQRRAAGEGWGGLVRGPVGGWQQ